MKHTNCKTCLQKRYQVGCSDQQLANISSLEDVLTVPQSKFILGQLTKMQKALVDLCNRVSMLEGSAPVAVADTSATDSSDALNGLTSANLSAVQAGQVRRQSSSIAGNDWDTNGSSAAAGNSGAKRANISSNEVVSINSAAAHANNCTTAMGLRDKVAAMSKRRCNSSVPVTGAGGDIGASPSAVSKRQKLIGDP
jgi:hypothetical protein